MSRTVLVTGGAGYVGSHACKALRTAGYLPVAYDSLVHGHEWAVKWGPLEKGGIEDRARLSDVLSRRKPSAVLHFAAFVAVSESVADPARYYRNNVAGTLTLLEAIREHGVRRFVFSSTCATYGIPREMPIPESHPQEPVNPYGTSKLVIERMLRDFAPAYGLRSAALRYFNAAGADPGCEIGESHDPETHLIPLVLGAAAGDRPEIVVFGNDYPTLDGTCVRDYVHVTDLADAHVRALEAIGRAPTGASGTFEAYNLGNNRGYSVKEVIAAAERVTGCDDAEAAAEATPTALHRDLGTFQLRDLAPELRRAAAELVTDAVSRPVIAGGIINVLVVCSRTDPTATLPSRDEVRESLLDQRLALIARGYLRDLRRVAFVDIRL